MQSEVFNPCLPTMIEALERSGEWVLETHAKSLLLAMSAPTMERNS
jgi:hypothetical protein